MSGANTERSSAIDTGIENFRLNWQVWRVSLSTIDWNKRSLGKSRNYDAEHKDATEQTTPKLLRAFVAI